jgi:RES domain-containing protein
MIVYRLSAEKYKKDLSGTGAEKAGGRWNSKGMAMLYTSESRALCTTEIAVHTALGNMPDGYHLITIELPDTAIFEIDAANLPADWKSIPHANSTQLIGDDFLRNAQFLIMKAPSVVVPGDFNYLVNPAHPLFKKVKLLKTEPFEFDKRLFGKTYD